MPLLARSLLPLLLEHKASFRLDNRQISVKQAHRTPKRSRRLGRHPPFQARSVASESVHPPRSRSQIQVQAPRIQRAEAVQQGKPARHPAPQGPEAKVPDHRPHRPDCWPRQCDARAQLERAAVGGCVAMEQAL